MSEAVKIFLILEYLSKDVLVLLNSIVHHFKDESAKSSWYNLECTSKTTSISFICADFIFCFVSEEPMIILNQTKQKCTYFLKLTTAWRSSPWPMTLTDVTLPYLLYSWKRPSRMLVSVERVGNPRMSIPSGFLSAVDDDSLLRLLSRCSCDPPDATWITDGSRLSRLASWLQQLSNLDLYLIYFLPKCVCPCDIKWNIHCHCQEHKLHLQNYGTFFINDNLLKISHC